MKYIDRKKVEWNKKKGYMAQIFFDFKEKGNNSRFVLIKMEPHTKIRPHYHTKIKEILFITKGTGKIIIKNEERHCKPEDIILIEPEEIHKMINDTENTFEWLEFKMHDPEEDDIFFPDD